jgi:hypothetical protein
MTMVRGTWGKRLYAALALVVLAVPCAAPAWVWIRPSSWRLAAPGEVSFLAYSRVEHGGSSAPLNRENLDQAIAIDARGRRDLLAAFPAGTTLPVRIRAPGSTIIAIHTRPVNQTVPAAGMQRFIADNFPELVATRKGHETQDAIVTTSYFAKSIVQIGGKASANYFAPVGQALELVPLDAPFASTERFPPLTAKAYVNGAPAPTARVIGIPLIGADDEWGPARAVTGGGLGWAMGQDSLALWSGYAGAIFRVMHLEPRGDGLHYTLRFATLALRLETEKPR